MKTYAPAVAAGLAYALAFQPGPYGLMAVAGLAGLLAFCVRGRRPDEAFRLGWAFGAVAWLAGMPWLWKAMEPLRFPAVFDAFVIAGIGLYNGLMYALAAAAASAGADTLERRRGLERTAAEALAFVPAMAAVDGLFPAYIPNPLASTQLGVPVMVQSLDAVGPGGLAWLICLCSAAVYAAAARPSRLRAASLAAAALLAAGNAAYGRSRIAAVDAEVARRRAAGSVLKVALIQSGVPNADRFLQSRYAANLKAHREQTKRALAQGGVELIAWPENSFERPLPLAKAADTLVGTELEELREPAGPDLLVGAVGKVAGSRRKLVASLLLDRGRRVRGMASKVYRTPLSEFLPFDDLIPYPYHLAPEGLWYLFRGSHTIMETSGGVRLGVFICYESLIDTVGLAYARAGAEVLINPANGEDAAPPAQVEQHLKLSAMRAIETRRYLLRPSAATVAFDPVGRAEARLPTGRAGHLLLEIPRMDLRPPFLFIGHAFYWLAAACLCLLLPWPGGRRCAPSC